MKRTKGRRGETRWNGVSLCRYNDAFEYIIGALREDQVCRLALQD